MIHEVIIVLVAIVIVKIDKINIVAIIIENILAMVIFNESVSHIVIINFLKII